MGRSKLLCLAMRQSPHEVDKERDNVALPALCEAFRSIVWTRQLTVPLLGFLVFANTLSAGFVWDDRAAVYANQDVLGTRPLMEAFKHDFWGQNITLPRSHKSYRPLTILTLRLNYALSGLNPFSYHLLNAALHAVVCSLVSTVAHRILKSDVQAFLAGVIFAVHPVHCDAVASIVGRADVLTAVFYLGGVLVYDHSLKLAGLSQWAGFTAAVVLAITGMLSKESGFTAFGMYFIMEILHVTKGLRDWKPLLVLSGSAARLIALPVIAAVLLCARVAINGPNRFYPWSINENHLYKLPFGFTKVLSIAHTHAKYFWLLFWPNKLSYDWGFNEIPLVLRKDDPRLIGIVTSYALVLAVLFLALANRNKRVLMSLMLGILPFLPALNIFMPVGAMVAERLLYLPSVGFCLLAGYAMGQTLDKLLLRIASSRKSGDHSVAARYVYFMLGLLSLVTVLFGARTVIRNFDWHSEKSLFETGYQVAPGSIKTANNLAQRFLQPVGASRAAEILQKTIATHPSYVEGLSNLGLAHMFTANYELSVRYLVRSIQYRPADASNLGYLGQSLMSIMPSVELVQGKSSPAYLKLKHYATLTLDASITHGSRYPLVYHNRGTLAFADKRYNDAIRYYEAAVRANAMLQPIESGFRMRNWEIANMIGLCYMELGELDRARDVFIEGTKEEPTSVPLHLNLGSLYCKLNDYASAIEVGRRAHELDPEEPAAMTNLGFALENSGDLPAAEEWYRRAYEMKPDHPQIKRNYEWIRSRLAQQS